MAALPYQLQHDSSANALRSRQALSMAILDGMDRRVRTREKLRVTSRAYPTVITLRNIFCCERRLKAYNLKHSALRDTLQEVTMRW